MSLVIETQYVVIYVTLRVIVALNLNLSMLFKTVDRTENIEY